jgi:hypothetical protein
VTEKLHATMICAAAARDLERASRLTAVAAGSKDAALARRDPLETLDALLLSFAGFAGFALSAIERRDFGDVSPLRGVIGGGGRHRLSVRVSVQAE